MTEVLNVNDCWENPALCEHMPCSVVPCGQKRVHKKLRWRKAGLLCESLDSDYKLGRYAPTPCVSELNAIPLLAPPPLSR